MDSTPATTERRPPIRVLVVDDSASVRMALSKIIADDPQLELAGTAADPYIAADRLRRDIPDVLILDIEMPRMDGLTFLKKIMAQRPIPVVICSTLTEQGSEMMMKAFEAGAVEVIAKPRVDTARALQESSMTVCDALKAAAHAAVRGARMRPRPPASPVEARHDADVVLPALTERRAAAARENIPRTAPIVCVGASTGGTEALHDLLRPLPATCPPIVVVQHMPPKFTYAFARRLDEACAVTVKEAEDGDVVRAGCVLIAPGGRHMLLRRRGSGYFVELADGECVARHRPSVDVLFRSAAQCAGRNAIGVIMTGMGDDGARGMKEMHDMGARTLAQSEESCVVFGMPKEAIARGGVEHVVALRDLPGEIMKAVSQSVPAGAR